MKEISVLIPTWITSGQTIGAIRSLRKFYPNIPVFIVDDEFNEKDVETWKSLYSQKEHRKDRTFDPDSMKLIGIENSCYIRKKHEGYETEGHGRAVTYAMNFIHTKWVLHLSSDVRIVKDGVIEFMLQGEEENWGAIGEKGLSPEGYINLGKWLVMYRADVYHQMKANFLPDSKVPVDAGTPFFTSMKNNGFKVIDKNFSDYYIHLRYNGNDKDWESLYDYRNI